ncbi:putative DsbA family dithiol-disulfide isomerase [Kitasatospora sp. SolWspMP-SS2h]|uniref:DsbA family oxidoreductase n=1 Tax=Kitasatospora sp. SolWspMP-SS2h TaxID=1305729 RepID=UPI000DB9F6E3|nr:DsbA family oxidoreductase [Kitasatospora sp. SolWspMP-SS2h]RAJ45667.1 putative DsbA family dithiol-disulfide isomerase [Kitasatospora sp. SolWspMP-SS2h]
MTGTATGKVGIKVWSDYVCPFCMLAEGPLQEAVRDLDVEIEWMPFELRPHPTPTLRPEDPYLPAIWERSVYPMARRMGVDLTLPTVSPQPYTRLAFEGYQYAAEHGRAAEYTPRLLRAFFQEDRDIGRIDVLADIAAELGLDADEFSQALIDGSYTETHRAALRTAEAFRISVAPTIIIDGRHRIEGVPTAAQLRKAVLDARAEQDAAGEAPACRIDGC